ncbi:nascent polypeptide-associated complex subunit alpha, muscle-specific form-like [Talpa occidentalis]|uniref:nascent polypeptide-associated complex subunit alpha, muscle-specific form-like n=1 Tax=Talpa occidentalis TaxID=50954 RepID=UPI00188ECA23|nr:nascent polypeptide-associated complex subunit alpha, muscle-specific form-like [Talpa occidentalis]
MLPRTKKPPARPGKKRAPSTIQGPHTLRFPSAAANWPRPREKKPQGKLFRGRGARQITCRRPEPADHPAGSSRIRLPWRQLNLPPALPGQPPSQQPSRRLQALPCSQPRRRAPGEEAAQSAFARSCAAKAWQALLTRAGRARSTRASNSRKTPIGPALKRRPPPTPESYRAGRGRPHPESFTSRRGRVILRVSHTVCPLQLKSLRAHRASTSPRTRSNPLGARRAGARGGASSTSLAPPPTPGGQTAPEQRQDPWDPPLELKPPPFRVPAAEKSLLKVPESRKAEQKGSTHQFPRPHTRSRRENCESNASGLAPARLPRLPRAPRRPRLCRAQPHPHGAPQPPVPHRPADGVEIVLPRVPRAGQRPDVGKPWKTVGDGDRVCTTPSRSMLGRRPQTSLPSRKGRRVAVNSPDTKMKEVLGKQ